MDERKKILFLLGIIIIFQTEVAQCLKLELYEDSNYAGFQGDYSQTGETEMGCIKLDNPSTRINSVKTDKCVMLYYHDDCDSSKHEAGENEVLRTRFDRDTPEYSSENPFFASSFHVCSQELGGGPQLDVDIYEQPNYQGAVKQYRSVCDCQNIPLSLTNSDFISIDDHGNQMELFSGENCQGSFSVALDAEDSSFNRRISTENSAFEGEYLRSFRPLGLDNCYRLHADIFKFHFSNGTDSIDGLPTKNVKLAVDSEAYNNGTTEDTHKYSANSKSTDTVEFTVADSISKLDSAGVESSVEMTTEIGVPGIVKGDMTAKIAANYQFSRTDTKQTTNATKVSTDEEIKIELELKIPACSYCRITSYVKKVKNFPVNYEAYVRVHAPNGEKRVPAEILREKLPPGMTYTGDYDKYTVEAVTTGTMFVEYGMAVRTHKHCRKLPDCNPNQQRMSAPRREKFGGAINSVNGKTSVKMAQIQVPTIRTYFQELRNIFARALRRLDENTRFSIPGFT